MISFRYTGLLWLTLLLGVTGATAADDASTLAENVAQRFTPAQLAAFVVAAGKRERPAGEAGDSLEALQRTLEVNDEVGAALLRILDRPGLRQEQLSKDIAKSAIEYHAIITSLGKIRTDTSDERQLITQTREALERGRFDEAEMGILQWESREILNSARASDPNGESNEHQIRASQARTLLGRIALIKQDYGAAAEAFALARQRVAQVNVAASAVADPPSEEQPVSEPTGLPPPSEPTAVTAAAVTVASPVSPKLELAAPPAGSAPSAQEHAPVVTALATPPRTMAAVEPQSAQRPVVPAPSKEVLDKLLQRGDAMLALGDLVAARLFYQRAAAEGDARGAIGAAKTFDPRILAKIGARGVQADPAAAASWYRRAFALGDASAASQLQALGQ